MSTIATPVPVLRQTPALTNLHALATLVRRRFTLTARTPRELVVPLLTPVLFALVIAPALLIPLNTMFAGLGVIGDRETGAQPELLAAPIPRFLLVLANLVVALAVTALQVGVLIVAALARGIHFDASATGVLWFGAAATLFAIGMYGVAETLA